MIENGLIVSLISCSEVMLKEEMNNDRSPWNDVVSCHVIEQLLGVMNFDKRRGAAYLVVKF